MLPQENEFGLAQPSWYSVRPMEFAKFWQVAAFQLSGTSIVWRQLNACTPLQSLTGVVTPAAVVVWAINESRMLTLFFMGAVGFFPNTGRSIWLTSTVPTRKTQKRISSDCPLCRKAALSFRIFFKGRTELALHRECC